MIRGITEASFLDWDGRVVAVLYTAKCNFRCPFCHNWQLMEQPEQYPEKDWPFIEAYLKEHRDFLDGVCITGGEPTLESGLEALIRRIRALDLAVKLDTNGSRPKVLKHLLDENLLGCVAMDVKAPFDKRYSKVTGVEPELDKIQQSVQVLRDSGIEHEFRTTVVPTLHAKEDIVEVARQLKGARRYVLQQFVPGNTWSQGLRDVKPFENDMVLDIASACRGYVDEVVVRGLR